MELVVGENTYLTVDELDSIIASDFIIENLNLSVEEKEIGLINATSYFDVLFKYKYQKLDNDQLLEFPRVHYDEDFFELVTPINDDIKLITARLCYYMKTSPEMFKKESVSSGQVKKEKMDIFETEYFELKSDDSIEFIDKLDIHTQKLLEKYIVGGGVKYSSIFEYRTLI